MKKYGILLIGCGHIGLEHLSDIHYRDNIEVIAVIDTDIAAAKHAAEIYCVPEYSDTYETYLCDPRVVIAIVATYTDTHTAITKEFLTHKKHVLCEKPVAPTLEEGRSFFDIALRSNAKVLVAHILRHNQSYREIAKLLASGVIGEVRLIRMVQNHHAMNWERYKRLLADCTPALDCGIHYFDIVRWFTGSEFSEISGFGTKLDPDSPNINYTCVNFRLENGCVGYYEAGWGKNTASMNLKEFIGTKGRIELTMSGQRAACREEGDLITVFHGDTGAYDTINISCDYKDMYSQLMTLIDMIENNSAGFPTLLDARAAFEIAAAADLAVREGTTVRFSDGKPII